MNTNNKSSNEAHSEPLQQCNVRRSTFKEKVLSVLPDYKFTASDIAELLNIELTVNNGFYKTCPKVSKALLELCKDGILYQWVLGTGGGLDGLSYNSHKWELYYLKRDSELAKQLLMSRGRLLNNYRFR